MHDPSDARGVTGVRKPAWLRAPLGGGERVAGVRRLLARAGLHTVCEEALCPNRGECWRHGRATVMILGNACTRGCRFCAVGRDPGGCVDAGEPARVAEAARELGLRDIVITSVTRDDLADGGASLWAETVRRVRAAVPGISVEVLVPDFGGDGACVDAVLAAGPQVFGHNLETVPALYATARPEADYARSLAVLRRAAARGFVAKTSLMLGLGESRNEILATMRDARDAGCEIFYAGQYLQPTRSHLPVARYVEPAEFEAYREAGLAMGFGAVVAGPLVRSSYHSDEQAAYLERRVAAAREVVSHEAH